MASRTITSGVMVADTRVGAWTVNVANFSASPQAVTVTAYIWGGRLVSGSISSPSPIEITPAATATVQPNTCFAFGVPGPEQAIGILPQSYPALVEIRIQLENDPNLVVHCAAYGQGYPSIATTVISANSVRNGQWTTAPLLKP